MRRSSTHFFDYGLGPPVSLLGPEILLPSQYELLFAKRERLTPQQRLMVAVLESAVYDLQRYRHARRMREKRFFREAYEWFTMQDNIGPFSFIGICQALGLEPDYLRAGLLIPLRGKEKAI
jgi:hypothetical protein